MGDIGEIKKIANVYSKLKTYTFIIEIAPSGREKYYNGYVIKVCDDMLIFFDEKLQKEIPILLDYIRAIEPSRKKEGEDDLQG